jgi:hypothetical protein
MKQKTILRIGSILTILGLINLGIPRTAEAAGLTTVKDYLSTLAESQTSLVAHEINFTPATAVSGGAGLNKIILVFPDGDDGTWCATAGTDLVVATTSLKDSATVLPGTSKTAKCVKGTGASSYDTLTIEGVDNLTGGTLYGVKISDGATGKLGTPANTTTGIVTVKTNNGSSDIDTGYIAFDILTSNQISISGRVDPTLSFSITDSAIGFGTITAAAVRHATSDEVGAASEPANGNPTQLSVTTNADDGAVVEIRDTNPNSASGMYSAGTGLTLVSTASTGVSLGSEEFGVYGKNASSLTIAEAFDNDSNADAAISTTFQTLASSTAPVASATVDVAAVAAVAGTTPAGTFANTLYVVATGKF